MNTFSPGNDVEISFSGTVKSLGGRGITIATKTPDNVPVDVFVPVEFVSHIDEVTTNRRRFIAALKAEKRPKGKKTLFGFRGEVCPLGIAAGLWNDVHSYQEYVSGGCLTSTIHDTASDKLNESPVAIYELNDNSDLSFSEQADYWAAKWGLK